MSTAIQMTDRRAAIVAAEQPEVQSNALLAVMDRLANNPNLDADKIERLLNVFIDGQRKMAEMTDERAFAEAMADFKKNPPEIVKRKVAKMKGVAKGSGREYEMSYSYADLEEYTSAAMPALAERGITWSFPFSEAEDGKITVRCVLRYGLYEHTPTTLSSAPDDSGNKNAIQQKGSTISYLERYTFCGATGLVAAMPDTDGHRQQPKPVQDGPTEEQEARLQEWVDAIHQCGDLNTLKSIFADAYKFAGSISPSAKERMRVAYEDMKRRLA
jgi:hypothetical protein